MEACKQLQELLSDLDTYEQLDVADFLTEMLELARACAEHGASASYTGGEMLGLGAIAFFGGLFLLFSVVMMFSVLVLNTWSA